MAVFKIYEPKGKLTCNLVGSIGVTCRPQIANLLRSEIEDDHHGRHLENQFFASSP